MKKVFLFILLFNTGHLFAQRIEKSKPVITKQEDLETTDKKSNLFTGGSLSFGLSSYGFNAGLHPHFGYTLSKWIDVAAVVNFEYTSQKDYYDNKNHSTIAGLGVFTRIYPVRFAFIQIQPEENYIHQKFIQNGGPTFNTNYTVPSLLLGVGYTPSRGGKNSFSYFTLMIDVLKKVNSPYVDGYGNAVPIIRAGFNIGLFQKKRY